MSEKELKEGARKFQQINEAYELVKKHLEVWGLALFVGILCLVVAIYIKQTLAFINNQNSTSLRMKMSKIGVIEVKVWQKEENMQEKQRLQLRQINEQIKGDEKNLAFLEQKWA